MVETFIYIDWAGFSLGLVFNVVLICAVIKRTGKSVKFFGNMVLASSIMDIVYIATTVLCHYHIQIHGHVFITMSYGIQHIFERWFWLKNFISVMEYFAVLFAVLILPCQFYYRYYLLTSTAHCRHKERVLVYLIAVAFVLTWPMYILTMSCHYKSQKRGLETYEKLLDPIFFDKNNKTRITAAVDFRDWEAVMGFSWTGSVMFGAYAVALYYGYRSMTSISPHMAKASTRVCQLRRQFQRNLIAQAVNSFIFAVLPMGSIVMCVFLGLNTGSYSVFVILLCSWCPFMNAFMSLAIIQPYRRFVLQPFGKTSISTESPTGKVSVTVFHRDSSRDVSRDASRSGLF